MIEANRPRSRPLGENGHHGDSDAGESQTERSHPFAAEDDATIRRIKKLPTSVGAILMAAGVVGIIIMPGPIGAPLIVTGGLVLAPGVFGRVDNYMKRRFPDFRHHGIQAIGRFMTDMQQRYPSSED